MINKRIKTWPETPAKFQTLGEVKKYIDKLRAAMIDNSTLQLKDMHAIYIENFDMGSFLPKENPNFWELLIGRTGIDCGEFLGTPRMKLDFGEF
jgi:hypothetical protein